MFEFTTHRNKTIPEKVKDYRTLTIIFWVLFGVMVIILIICGVFTGITLDKMRNDGTDRDFIIFIVVLMSLIISSILFVAFLAFGINFTLLYHHYKKAMIEDKKHKKK